MRFEARERFAVTPERLWPLVSDTQRLNRVLGLPVIRFTTQPLPTGGSRTIGEYPYGSAVLSLIGQVVPFSALRRPSARVLRWLPKWPVARWVEHPFEWEEPRRYAVLRDYYWSFLGLFPFASFRGGAELLRIDGGTEVIAFADIEPRNALGSLLTRLVLGPRNVQGVIQQCRIFEQYLLGRIPHPFPQLTRTDRAWRTTLVRTGESTVTITATGDATALVEPREQVGASAITQPLLSSWQALTQLDLPAELVEQLRRHLLEAPDEEVHKMRPFELADRWGAERRQTLVLFLQATTAGLLEMTWDVLCPNCRVSNVGYASLVELKGEAHCDACNVTYDALVDRQVEVRFTVAPAVRAVQTRQFCTGGPMSLSHVVAQAELSPGERRELELALQEGDYRLRSPQAKAAALLAVEPSSAGDASSSTLSFVLEIDGLQPRQVDATPGATRLQLVNEAEVPALVTLERSGWADTAATAAYVGTLQEFRDLFGSEVLAPGLQLAIQRLAFLFTDLTGSTALYQAVGQARAFRLVQDHFQVLGRVIASHDGALVKTIGDAVMATFNTSAEALQAALAMQREMLTLQTDGVVDPARLLKVGIHEGPCIAVGANGRLDYFGTTVNMAARVQHESRGGEVVLSADVFTHQRVQEILRHERVTTAESTVTLRGIREPIAIYRLTAASPLPLA